MRTQHEIILTIGQPGGLHLRPAALFVTTTCHFQSTIHITNLDREGQPERDAKSLFGVRQQAIAQRHCVRMRADGPDARKALTGLQQRINHHYEADA